MTSNEWSFCDITTGRFTGKGYSGPAAMLAKFTPENCRAVEGRHDHRCRIFNPLTGQVESWQPPAPASSELLTHEWDTHQERWLPVKTAQALKLERVNDLKKQLADLEIEQARPQREVLLSMLEGKKAPTAALEKLAEIESSARILRQQIQES